MKKGNVPVLLLLLLTGSLLSGCGTQKTLGSAPTDEPITLTVYKSGAALTQLEFEQFFADPVKKKYPNITMKFLEDSKGSAPSDLIAAGTYPDIIFGSNTSLFDHKKTGWVADLTPYLKKNPIDLKRVKPVIMDSLSLYADKGQMIALPFSLNYAALFYNKDIFDKFGVPYPKDAVPWDETMSLAKKLTREDGGKQYIGIDLTEPDRPGGGLSLPLVDPQTGKAVLDTDGWKRVFNLLNTNYEIPGYIGPKGKWTYGASGFLKDQILAMIPNWSDGIIGPAEEMYKNGQIINYDIAGLSNFPEALGTEREVDVHTMMLCTGSKHPEAAFKVMTYMLSDEVQTLIAKAGRFSVLESTDMEHVFGADLKSLEGKHVEGIFKTKPRPLHKLPSEYDKAVKTKLKDAAKAVALKQKDINTALRDAQDDSDKMIAEDKEGKGK